MIFVLIMQIESEKKFSLSGRAGISYWQSDFSIHNDIKLHPLGSIQPFINLIPKSLLWELKCPECEVCMYVCMYLWMLDACTEIVINWQIWIIAGYYVLFLHMISVIIIITGLLFSVVTHTYHKSLIKLHVVHKLVSMRCTKMLI